MSQAAKVFASLLSHSLGNILYRAASLLVIAMYAKAFGPEDFGGLEKILALSLLLIPLVSLQIPDAALSVLNSPAGRSTSALMLLLFSSLPAAVAFVLMALGWIQVQVGLPLLSIVITGSFWQLFRNLLRANGRWRFLVICEIGQSAILVLSGYVFITLGSSYSSALSAMAAGNCMAVLIASYAILRYSYIKSSDLSPEAANKIISVAKKLLPNVLIWWVIELSDRWILSYYIGDADMGQYAAGARVAGIGMAIALLIYQSFQVFAVREIERGSEAGGFFPKAHAWYIFGVSLVFSGLIVGMGLFSSALFGDDFVDAKVYGAMLVPAMFLSSSAYFFGVVYFSPSGSARPWLSAISGLLVSVFTNLFLVPILGAIAAPISLFLAFSVVLYVRYRESKAVFNLRLGARNFAVPLSILCIQSVAAAAGMSFGILMIAPALLIAWNWGLTQSLRGSVKLIFRRIIREN